MKKLNVLELRIVSKFTMAGSKSQYNLGIFQFYVNDNHTAKKFIG